MVLFSIMQNLGSTAVRLARGLVRGLARRLVRSSGRRPGRGLALFTRRIELTLARFRRKHAASPRIQSLRDFARLVAHSRRIRSTTARALEARFIGMRFRSMNLPALPQLPQMVKEILIPEAEALQAQGVVVHGYVLRRRDTRGPAALLKRR